MHYNQRMQIQKLNTWFCLLLITALSATAGTSVLAQSVKPHERTSSDLRVLSWNLGEDAFADKPAEFQSLIQHIKPDILLLDEVKPIYDERLLRNVLDNPESQPGHGWFIDFGTSGGRQVGVIASRYPLEKVPEFSGKLDYAQQDYDYIVEHMSEREKTYQNWTINDGIAANAAIILIEDKRLLAVTFDMQCCGGDPASWQEYRRRAEARSIRQLILKVLQRTHVDGMIVAGDLNIISTPMPLVILSNLSQQGRSNLSIAEVYQRDGGSWTWDGRGTKYPSRVMDFQLYSPQSIQIKSGFIFNSELLVESELEQLGFETNSSKLLSDHLPIIIDYQLD